jgi:mannan endo-1,4-beta-mannosidase
MPCHLEPVPYTWSVRSSLAFGSLLLTLACSSNGSQPHPSPSTGGAAAGGTSGISGANAVGGQGGLGATSGAGGGGGTATGTAGSGTAGTGTAGTGTAGSGTAGTGTAGSGGSVGTGTGGASSTFHVEGRFLYDRCNEKVVLRGVNEMVVWTAGKDGAPEFTDVAQTGANSVRIVWNEEGSAAELETAITNALAAKLIPMVEHHSATGKLPDVATKVVPYWTKTDVAQILVKHQANLLLNIANEAGDDKVTQEAFESTYKAAITAIRGIGFKGPLVIDAPQWGQDIDRLQASGPALIVADPLHNLMFSVHMWWSDPQGTRVKKELQESADMNLPLVVGEFAQHAVYLCDQSPFAYSVLLDEAHTREIGWLAWSWGGVTNSDCSGMGTFDMTTGGKFGSWTGKWASDVAVDHPQGLKTAVRPKSIVTGACQ